MKTMHVVRYRIKLATEQHPRSYEIGFALTDYPGTEAKSIIDLEGERIHEDSLYDYHLLPELGSFTVTKEIIDAYTISKKSKRSVSNIDDNTKGK